MTYQPNLLLLLMLVPSLVAALYDIWQRRIPNWLTLAIALLFFPAAFIGGLEWQQMAWHLLAGVIFLFAGMGLNAIGILGGGDAKLATAIALWVGFWQLHIFLFWIGILGGVLSIAYFIFSRLFRKPELNLPYGVAIAGAGFVLALPHLTIN